MPTSLIPWLAAVALFATPWAARAQGVTPAERPDPLNAAAAVPALDYASSFMHYRRTVDATPTATAWPAANETVNRIGGWRAYAREAQTTDAPTGVSPTPQSEQKAPPPSPATLSSPPATLSPPPGKGPHAHH